MAKGISGRLEQTSGRDSSEDVVDVTTRSGEGPHQTVKTKGSQQDG